MKYMIRFLLVGRVFLFSNLPILELPKEVTSDWEEKVFGKMYGVTTLDKSIEEISSVMNEKGFGADFIGRVHQEILAHSSGEGEYVEYWENGKIKVKLPYKNGKAHGHIHGWYDNGKEAFSAYFNEGVKQGIHMVFFKKTEHLRPKFSLFLIYDENGRSNGSQIRRITQDHPMITMSYLDGKPEGLANLSVYDNNDKIKDSFGLYKDGVLKQNLNSKEKSAYEYPPKKYIGYINNLCQRFLSRLQQKYFITEYVPEGCFNFGLEEIDISISFIGVGTIERAREMVIEIGEEFLHMISLDKKIRPYLRAYPFTQDRISFSIKFAGRNTKYNTKNSIDYVEKTKENEIRYALKSSRRYEEVLQEDYEEAKKICKMPNTLYEIESDSPEEVPENDYHKELRISWMQDFLGIRFGINTLTQAVIEILFETKEEGFDDDFIDFLETVMKLNLKGEGKCVQYWKNGKIKVSLPFKDGKPDGTLKGWYENGKRAFIGTYKNGIKQGIHRTYYKTKWFQRKRLARVIKYNQEGKLDGRSEIYMPNGKKIVLTDYKNGLLHGKMRVWDLMGNVVIDNTFIDDEIVNPYE